MNRVSAVMTPKYLRSGSSRFSVVLDMGKIHVNRVSAIARTHHQRAVETINGFSMWAKIKHESSQFDNSKNPSIDNCRPELNSVDAQLSVFVCSFVRRYVCMFVCAMLCGG